MKITQDAVLHFLGGLVRKCHGQDVTKIIRLIPKGELQVFFQRLKPEDVPEDVKQVLHALEQSRADKRKANKTPDEAHMPLRKTPMRPKWMPMYSWHSMRIASWSKFLSEAYWNVELDE